ASAAAWACSSKLAAPTSPEMETIQRRPVHSPSLWPRRWARLGGALGPGLNSIRPGSKCTRCTWRTRLVRRIKSPSASAEAATSRKLSGTGALGWLAGSPAGGNAGAGFRTRGWVSVLRAGGIAGAARTDAPVLALDPLGTADGATGDAPPGA